MYDAYLAYSDWRQNHELSEEITPLGLRMFAVPGWSVSADALKVQADSKALKPPNDHKSEEVDASNKKSRKRKRGPGSSKGVQITEENLGDLWRKHIEQKSLDVPIGNNGVTGEKQRKKRKRERQAAIEGAEVMNGDARAGLAEGDEESEAREQAEPVEKQGKKQMQKEKLVDETIQENGQVHATADTPLSEKADASADFKKAKFEERKAKAAEKRKQKALLQANGTLPPVRADPLPPTPIPLQESKKARKANGQTSSENSVTKNPPDTSNSPQKHLPAISVNPPPSSAKLTPLQQRMAAKLTSARFRHLNQTLYTSPSDQAMQLFNDSPQAYTSYHAGFRAQVAVWPQNPVEGFIADIKTRGRFSNPSQKKMWRDQKKGKKQKEGNNGDATTNGDPLRVVEPLPRNRHGTCTIADLGCGDATLASSLAPLKKSLNISILSFDLAKGDSPNAQLITVTDITNLRPAGVKDGDVDVAICCLSLMGTNWVDVVDEGARAVRGGGEFWVAEIKSRFARPGQVTKGKKGDGIGKKKAKTKAETEGVDEEPDDLVEVEEEGGKSVKDETDVSAFVDVFRKRGFNLKGEPDMTNKMFVRMRFVKGLRPERVAENEKGGAAKFGDGFKGKQRAKTKFVDDGEEVDEIRVLKPCVYKTR